MKKVIGKQSFSRGSEHKVADIEVEIYSLDEFYSKFPDYAIKRGGKK